MNLKAPNYLKSTENGKMGGDNKSRNIDIRSHRKVELGKLAETETLMPISEVVQSCPILFDPMDCSLPDSAVHGIFQARILEWAAMSSSRGSYQPRDQTQVYCIAGRRFTV